MNRRLFAIATAVLLILLTGPIWLDGITVDSWQSNDARVRDISGALRCPVCENLSVADSPSQLAQQMRDVVRRKVEAGQTREEILTYFVERYGEDVRTDPPKRGVTLLVWLGPPIALALLGGGFALAAERWRRAAPTTTDEIADPADAERHLARLRQDLDAARERVT